MIKNNMKALGIHLLLMIISGFVGSQVFIMAEWVSVEAQRAHELQIMRTSYILFIAAIVFYFLFGIALFHKLGNLKENIMSVISIFLIGLLIWLFIIFKFGFPNESSLSNGWGLYLIYIAYAIPLTVVTKLSSPFILLLFSLIPSLAMFFGILVQRNNK